MGADVTANGRMVGMAIILIVALAACGGSEATVETSPTQPGAETPETTAAPEITPDTEPEEDPDAAPDTTDGAPSEIFDPCELLSAAEVEAHLGLPDVEEGVPSWRVDEQHNSCDWHSSGRDSFHVLVMSYDNFRPDSFDGYFEVQMVDGFGERAMIQLPLAQEVEKHDDLDADDVIGLWVYRGPYTFFFQPGPWELPRYTSPEWESFAELVDLFLDRAP